jgi:hypothetical protein
MLAYGGFWRFTVLRFRDPRITNREHRFLCNGSRKALISYSRDEHVEAMAPRRK